ncbi:MAG TPA: TonB-dependent receptor [Bryobacteraceae bacterium]|nr:TonB-dependent receptor [Bryobacteraceae bacterium]
MKSRIVWIVALCYLLASAGMAQDPRGSITGTVTDPSGAVVPNANVEVINKAMGTRITLKTNEAGVYNALYLIPGRYQVVVEIPGFKKAIHDDIEVRIDDRIAVNVQLEVGVAEQTVTVTGETPLLSTETASTGTVVDSRRVTELPIPHGNPYFLINLATGVSFTRNARLDRPFEPTHIVGYAIDGTRANRSDVTIDGAVSTATANPGEVIASYVPPADIVQEFKVQTATFDAQFGHTEGGVTNISLKSGSNEFHGTGYYTNMTPSLFANDFFANRDKIPLADFYYHRYGASLGGPIILPKLYSGRNRTFFQWGMEGIKEGRPRNNGTPTVPTEAMKNGDFSALLNVSSSFQIYNPWTRRPAAGGRFQSDPFPDNIIPASLFNPVAKKVLDTYYPKPLQAGNPDGTNNYLRPELMETADYLSNTIRVDHNITENNRMFFRVSWYDRDSWYNDYFDNAATGQSFWFIARSAVVDDVWTLSPTVVLNARYGYNRFIRRQDGNPLGNGFDLTSIGFPASYNNAISPDIRRFPRFDITGYQGTGFGGENRPNDTHNVTAVLTKIFSRHSLKAGMEFRAYRETSVFFGNEQTGRFIFDATYTRGPLDNSPVAPNSLGQSVAAFLLGIPTGSSYAAVRDSYAEQSVSWSWFVQDDWKVSSRLTLNLGLRWEWDGPLTERFNRSVRRFDASYTQPFEEAARAVYANNPTPEVPVSEFTTRGGLTFAGVNGEPRSLYETPRNNFMPRFGFAYQIDPKTVMRGGYGIFFGFLGQRRGDVIQTGFSRNTPFIPTLDGYTFIRTLSDPFPEGLLMPVGAADGYQTYVGNSVSFFNEKPLRPYMQRWQLGFQRTIGAGYVAELNYVGNRGTHIEISQNFNATPLEYLSHSLLRDNERINYLTQNLPNPFLGLMPPGAVSAFTGANMARERLLRPFPHFNAVNASRFDGYSWYHALQASLEKRFSQSYMLGVSYTFSKFMQATETLNTNDPRPVEVISDLDRPHHLVVNSIWETPFGRGRRWGSNLPFLADLFLGGWQISGVYTFQSGAPINFGNIIFIGDLKDIRLPSDQRTVERWFNVDAGFERRSAFQLDRNVRWFPPRFSFLRAHGISNFDLALTKNTRLFNEKLNVQFKAEFLNAMNHPQFPAPNTTVTSAQFGQAIASNQANYPRRTQLMAKFIF